MDTRDIINYWGAGIHRGCTLMNLSLVGSVWFKMQIWVKGSVRWGKYTGGGCNKQGALIGLSLQNIFKIILVFNFVQLQHKTEP